MCARDVCQAIQHSNTFNNFWTILLLHDAYINYFNTNKLKSVILIINIFFRCNNSIILDCNLIGMHDCNIFRVLVDQNILNSIIRTTN